MTDRLINALMCNYVASVAIQARRPKPKLKKVGAYWQCGTETVAAFAPTPGDAYRIWLGGKT